MFAEVLTPGLQGLWRQLADRPAVTGPFVLAGGTALAVQVGHRRSFDLDFFTTQDFRPELLEQTLLELGGTTVSLEEGTLHVRFGEAKASFLRYPYRWISPPVPGDGLMLAAVPDIAAMKVVAISQRGTKKDFYDLYKIMQTSDPEQVKGWFLDKYGERKINCYHILRSLFFFEDAEPDPEPISLDGTTWAQVKAFFRARERTWFDALLSCPA
ncbi:MAG: nucleotidyl transferase AbiEii/AbiGii toxin family protein [Candidatus Riflebacteria bacterium]|nr:nucleotidyl transferase AbiEii/AbiGii toxin family protein [Candidatus Riflebacteria bacterium]